MKVALYARVSTDEQVQHGTSLSNQVIALKKFSKQNGHTIFDTYIDDGYSGGSLDRPALARLRQDAQNRNFDCVLVTKTDRFSRSLPQVVRLILEEFDQLGVSFRSITEPYETTTPSGKLLFINLASFADFERSTIRQRSVDGKRTKAWAGKCMASNLPFGYATNDAQDWLPHPTEASYYQQLVAWYIEDGLSFKSIADKLTALKVPTKFKKHGIWSSTVIQSILKNSIYTGTGTYAKKPFKLPALISQDRWDLLQRTIESRRLHRTPRNTHFYLLQGLMVCDKCGNHFFCVSKNRKHAANYYCLSKRSNHLRKFCGTPHIRQEQINQVVWNRVSNHLKSPQFLLKALEAGQGSAKTSEVTLEAQITALEKAIKAKSQEISHLLSLSGKLKNFSSEELDTQIGSVKTQQTLLMQDKAHLESKIKSHKQIKNNIKNVASYLQKLSTNIDALDLAQKRALLLKVVSKVIVTWNPERKRHGFKVLMKIHIPKEGVPPTPTKGKATLVKLVSPEAPDNVRATPEI